MSNTRRGVYAAVITPIDADSNPDLAGLVGYCQLLPANGCDGVAPLRNMFVEQTSKLCDEMEQLGVTGPFSVAA